MMSSDVAVMPCVEHNWINLNPFLESSTGFGSDSSLNSEFVIFSNSVTSTCAVGGFLYFHVLL